MTKAETTVLPPGQRARSDFPRFGLPQYADRIPQDIESREIDLGGDSIDPEQLEETWLDALPRIHQTSDFHCVTTWSHRKVRWSGYRFDSVFHEVLAPRLRPGSTIEIVVFRCRDGYRTALPLADLLSGDVLIADAIDDGPLGVEHGAPLRLLAPAHYGYKSAKHLKAIEVYADPARHRKRGLAYVMDHPRARVAAEERARGVPGWVLRPIYRSLICRNVERFRVGGQDMLGDA